MASAASQMMNSNVLQAHGFQRAIAGVVRRLQQARDEHDLEVGGNSARVGDEGLAGDLAGISEPHVDQPFIIQQPPIMHKRQANPLGAAARQVTDLLLRLRMPGIPPTASIAGSHWAARPARGPG
jgi:hypothetical protein